MDLLKDFTQKKKRIFSLKLSILGMKRSGFLHMKTTLGEEVKKTNIQEKNVFLSLNCQGNVHIAFQPLNQAVKGEDCVEQSQEAIEESNLDVTEIIFHDNARFHN